MGNTCQSNQQSWLLVIRPVSGTVRSGLPLLGSSGYDWSWPLTTHTESACAHTYVTYMHACHLQAFAFGNLVEDKAKCWSMPAQAHVRNAAWPTCLLPTPKVTGTVTRSTSGHGSRRKLSSIAGQLMTDSASHTFKQVAGLRSRCPSLVLPGVVQ